jgi:hypothetical protein
MLGIGTLLGGAEAEWQSCDG